MTKKIRGLIIGAIACCAVMGAASSAMAITVSPGGSITGTASTTTLVVNSITLTCTSSTIAATLSSAGSGSTSAVAFNSCSQRSLGSFTVTAPTSWSIGMALTTGAVTTTFSSVNAHIRSAIGCQFDVTGSQAITNSGTLPLTVSALNATAAGSSLTVSNSSGCLGLVNNGNAATFAGNYVLDTAQTVSG